MTAIAGFSVNGNPFLIGDLLVSGPENEIFTANIPTIGSVSEIFPTGSGFTVTGLRQKICIIDDHLMIAWAGPLISAKAIINDIIIKNKEKSFTGNSIINYFNNIDTDLYIKGTSFIVYLINEDISLTHFVYSGNHSDSYELDKIGPVYSCGTGKEFINGLIHKLEKFNKDKDLKTNMHGDDEYGFISFGLAMDIATSMMSLDIYSPQESILHYFGGGYELAICDEIKFRKFNDVTFFYWKAVINERNEIDFCLHDAIITYNYFNEILCIRTILPNSIDPNDPNKTIPPKFYLIPPVHREVNENDITTLKNKKLSPLVKPFISEWNVHLCKVLKIQGTSVNAIGINTHIARNIETPPPIQVAKKSGTDNKVTISISRTFVSKMKRTLSHDYINNVNQN